MKIDEFITDLRKNHNIIISYQEGELKIKASKESLTPKILSDIKEKKEEILNFFQKMTLSKSQVIPVAKEKEYYKLSSVQKRMFFLNSLDKSSLSYNVPQIVSLKGQLNKDKIKVIFENLVARHESLRTYFDEVDEKPVQRIGQNLDFEIAHFESNPSQVQTVINDFIKPFDLFKGPLIRVGLIEVAADDHVLMVDMHHIINDGVSRGILITEFMALYNNQQLPELRLQYKDFAEWQQGELQQEEIKTQQDFWLKQFADEITPLELPMDFARPKDKDSQGDSFEFEINQTHSKKLKAIADEEGTTMFMVLLSIYNVLLGKLSNQEDIVIGNSTSGRKKSGLENILGMFVNTLPLRNYPISSLSFREFLLDVTKRTFACFENEDYQFDDLVDDLKIERDTSRNPLFDVRFVFQNFDNAELKVPGLMLKPYDTGSLESKFDLTLTAMEKDGQVRLLFEYSTRLFQQPTIERFVSSFKQVVSIVTENIDVRISEIDIVTNDERQKLVHSFNHDKLAYEVTDTIVGLFDKQVLSNPDTKAIVFENNSLTYKELYDRSNSLARLIQSSISTSSGIIALYLAPTQDTIVSIMGVLKAGYAFLPLDPEKKSERNLNILKESGAGTVICQKNNKGDLAFSGKKIVIDEETLSVSDVEVDGVSPKLDSLSYVIYTSGSSGKPKGVKISHKNLANYSRWLQQTLSLSDKDKSILTSSYAFDLGYSSIFPALISGAELHLISKSVYQTPDTLLSYLNSNEISYLKMTPSLFTTMAEASNFGETSLDKMKFILLGGESIRVADVEKVRSNYDHIRFINHYGPTETTIGTIAQEIEDIDSYKSRITIGTPISNNRAYILDKDYNLVPLGTKGELCIAGHGVGLGYLNDDELTKDRFVKVASLDDKIYRTGDLAKWMPDGAIKFLGRSDGQIKIRGYRVELGEIENQLIKHEQVTEAVVTSRQVEANNFLVAYYVAEAEIDTSVLSDFLSETLTDYMVPSHYVHLDLMPLTLNGKVDQRALPEPEIKLEPVQSAPVNDIEEALVQVWSQVLKVDNIGVEENFFNAGGDSIKSIQITARMRKKGFKMAVNDIFTFQTIRTLAERVTKIETVTAQKSIEGNVPLTPVQKRFFDFKLINPNHYNQSIMLRFEKGITLSETTKIFKKIQEYHDALRMVFHSNGHQVKQENKNSNLPLSIKEYNFGQQDDCSEKVLEECNKIQASINIKYGPLMRLALFHTNNGTHLLIAVHHLVMDGVSWRILLEDIDSLHGQIKNGKALELPVKTDSYQTWANGINKYAETEEFKTTETFWNGMAVNDIPHIQRDNPEGANKVKDIQNESIRLTKEQTAKLLGEVHKAFGTQVNDIMLTALLMTAKEVYNQNSLLFSLEGHGREEIQKDSNVSRTIGWFTSIYPVMLNSNNSDPLELIRDVKETLRSIPKKGFDFLLHQSASAENSPIHNIENKSQIKFNYLGQFDANVGGNDSFSISEYLKGNEVGIEEQRHFDWDITGVVLEGQLEMRLSYSKNQYDNETIELLMKTYKRKLVELISFCSTYGKVVLTPSDLTYKALPVEYLDKLQLEYPVEDIYPLSPMQEGMLFHSLLDSDSQHHFEQKTFTITGELNLKAMQKSMNDLIARYEVLRTVFLHEGYERALQVVLKEGEVDFSFEDVRQQCLDTSVEEVLQFYKKRDKSSKFNLATDILMRVSVLQIGDNSFKLIWSHHHILMDGWCVSIIWRDLEMFYLSNISNDLPSLPPVQPYASYIQWLESRDKRESALYWENYLNGYESLATLPKKEYTTIDKATVSYGAEELLFSEEVTQNLNGLSKQYGVTLNTIIQSLWGVLLSKYNNSNDVVFGAVVSGRPSEIAGIESMVGLFINTVPVRVAYDDRDTFGELLKKVQKSALESEHHHYNPLSEIQTLSELGRGLLDHIMAFENYPIADQIASAEDQGGLTVSDVEIVEQPNYDLWVIIVPGDQIKLKIGYNADVYDQANVERVLSHFSHILNQTVNDSNQLITDIELLIPEERKQILVDFNDTKLEYASHKLMHQLFEEQVSKAPNNTAIVADGIEYTYDWLNIAANQLSVNLRQKGVVSETPVVVIMERRIELIVALFAILKSGGMYVPIEPYLPENRKLSILNSVKAKIIITNEEHQEEASRLVAGTPSLEHFLLLDNEGSYALDIKEVLNGELKGIYLSDYSSSNPEPINTSDDLAYVIFTSGSSGEPKGVAVQHKPVINLIEWVNNTYEVNHTDKILMVSSVSFDLSVYDIFGGLAVGACVRLANKEELTDPDTLAHIVIEEGITFWDSAPAMLQQVVPFMQNRKELAQSKGKLRLSFSSGDWIPLTLPDQMKDLFNNYDFIALGGATEATIWSNYFKVGSIASHWKSIPYGKPIQNARYLVLDRNRNLCPIGVQGDLYIGGPCLAKEYTNDKVLSDSKFIPSPFYEGEKLYSTGDTACWFPDGNLEFLGRKDAQVKIRGYRIELGEIESKLLLFDGVKQVLAHVIARSKYDKFICAYYISEEELDEELLKDFLAKELPEYMVPQHILHLEAIPITKNGKVDRKKLPEPQLVSFTSNKMPRTSTQKQIAKIWADLLHRREDQISIDADFFESGGHSIMAVHLISAIQHKFSVSLKLREVFENPTIDQLSVIIDGRNTEEILSISKLEQREYYPASPAQERLYYQQLMNPESLVYNINGIFILDDHIDIEKFQQSIQLLVNRHESLRTSFQLNDEGSLVQKITDNLKFNTQIIEHDDAKEVLEILKDFVKPFDLSLPSMMRCALYRNEGQNLFMIDIHHIISDGISMGILMRDFNDIYQGVELEPLQLRYIDFANWQNENSSQFEKQKQFWSEKLTGELPLLDLPVMQEREGVDIGPASSKFLTIDGNLYNSLKEFNASRGVSDFMSLLSIYQILLAKMTGSQDIIIGTDVVGRTHPDLQNVVGTFINLLPLRISVEDDKTYSDFLGMVKNNVLESFDNQDFQFDQMIDLLDDSQKKTGDFVQVHFAFANYVDDSVEEGDLRIAPYPIQGNRTTQYEFKLEASEAQDRITVEFIYSKALYDDETMEILMEYFNNILTSVLHNTSIELGKIEMEGSFSNA